MGFIFTATPSGKNSRAMYLQLLDIIEGQISDKTLVPGDLLPSENTFCDVYHVSRTTIRRTLHELEKLGLIVRKRGCGTFVCESKISRRLGNLYSFSEEMKRIGMTPSSKVLSYRLVYTDACPSNLRAFNSERLIEFVRLRLANGIPMLVEHTYLSVDLCPDLSWERLENNALYAILSEHYGLTPYKAVETYEAVLIPKEESLQLGCNAGDPAFFLRRSTWDKENRLIEYTSSIMPSSRSRFEITMYQDSVYIERQAK